jgi:hypothetical protein
VAFLILPVAILASVARERGQQIKPAASAVKKRRQKGRSICLQSDQLSKHNLA